MASQTVSRAQTVIGALRAGQAARACMARAVPVARPSNTGAFAPKREIKIRSRRYSTLTVAAGATGLPIDLRGATLLHRALHNCSSAHIEISVCVIHELNKL